MASSTPLNTSITITSITGVIQAQSGVQKGGTGNDKLTGQATNDDIQGLAGDDIITGLGGADALSGGLGNDIFRYTSLSESTRSAMDRLNDFTVGQDKIALPILVSELNLGISYPSTNNFNQALNSALGSPGVDAGEAVIFKWGSSARIQNAYVAIKDADLIESNDFVVRLPNLFSINLTAANLFTTI